MKNTFQNFFIELERYEHFFTVSIQWQYFGDVKKVIFNPKKHRLKSCALNQECYE